MAVECSRSDERASTPTIAGCDGHLLFQPVGSQAGTQPWAGLQIYWATE